MCKSNGNVSIIVHHVGNVAFSKEWMPKNCMLNISKEDVSIWKSRKRSDNGKERTPNLIKTQRLKVYRAFIPINSGQI